MRSRTGRQVWMQKQVWAERRVRRSGLAKTLSENETARDKSARARHRHKLSHTPSKFSKQFFNLSNSNGLCSFLDIYNVFACALELRAIPLDTRVLGLMQYRDLSNTLFRDHATPIPTKRTSLHWVKSSSRCCSRRRPNEIRLYRRHW